MSDCTPCGLGPCAAPAGHDGTCAQASGWDKYTDDAKDASYDAGFAAGRAAALAEQDTKEPGWEYVFIERYGMYHAKFGGIGGDVKSLSLTREAWKAMGEPGAVAVSVSPVEQERKTDSRKPSPDRENGSND